MGPQWPNGVKQTEPNQRLAPWSDAKKQAYHTPICTPPTTRGGPGHAFAAKGHVCEKKKVQRIHQDVDAKRRHTERKSPDGWAPEGLRERSAARARVPAKC